MTNSSIVIVHFGDIHRYPPAINLVRFFSGEKKFKTITVCTRSEFREKLENVTYWNTNNFEKYNKGFRFLAYAFFYAKTFLCLVLKQPETVLYYETLSYPPIHAYYLVTGLFRKKIKIYCHYHEYISPEEYKKGMIINKFAHKLESKAYKYFSWISQTNDYRKKLFLRDNPAIAADIVFLMPNYPPESWTKICESNSTIDILSRKLPLKIVYVGSLDTETMYVKELSQWVLQQNGDVIWDIYSAQFNNVTSAYFTQLNCPFISLKSKMAYNNLPYILPDYDIGVILYKGVSENYIYNEPNKYFEYYVCSLDVWYPKEMVGMTPNKQTDESPSTSELDFKNLPPDLLKESLQMMPKKHDKEYIAEKVYRKISEHIISNL